MGDVRPPKRVKLFAGLLVGDGDLFSLATRHLEKHFGAVDFESDTWRFDKTDYYEPEMGADIRRRFVFFEELVSIERLAEIKRLTNDIETRICDDLGQPHFARPVNIDPGYVAFSKMVLATTKDRVHRIYLQRGIYAEVTLRFESGKWRPWEWTFADYAEETYYAAFTQARERLKTQLSAS